MFYPPVSNLLALWQDMSELTLFLQSNQIQTPKNVHVLMGNTDLNFEQDSIINIKYWINTFFMIINTVILILILLLSDSGTSYSKTL